MPALRSSVLRPALDLFVERRRELLVPPGAEMALAAVAALAGWQVGLAMPRRLMLVRLLQDLLARHWGGIGADLAALAPPSLPLALVSFLLGLSIMVLSAGWLRVALAAARRETIGPGTWSDGLRGLPLILGWNLGTLGGIALMGVAVGLAGIVALRAAFGGGLSDVWILPQLLTGSQGVLWAFATGASVYYLAAMSLGAVVAVAEPTTTFASLFRKAPNLFVDTCGWRGLAELALLLGGWWLTKGLLMLAFYAPGELSGLWATVYAMGAAVLAWLLVLGDGVVLLLVILMGAIAYQRAYPAPSGEATGAPGAA